MTPGGLPLAAVRSALLGLPAGPLGVAVSGGGDSLALTLLLHALCPETGHSLAAVTVDHGLRPESAAEAAEVGRLCRDRGIPHAVLRWSDRGGSGNLQARARSARRGLIAGWAAERGITTVALGHTLDDQAETFLMRLARGSGVDGLAAMAPRTRPEGICWLRPLLGTSRASLRDWLAAQGMAWTEDPGNADLRFDRIRARAAMEQLAPLGLGAERLAATAAAMARARLALEVAAGDLARAAVRPGPAGDALIDIAALRSGTEELQLRVLAGVLAWVSGAIYRPRFASLAAARAALLDGRIGQGITLQGCVLRPRAGGRVAVRREPARVAPPVPLVARVWDRRWRIEADVTGADVLVGALGPEGLDRCPDWRARAQARETLLTTPALWRRGELVAAPLLRPDPRVRASLVPPLTPPWEARSDVESGR
ncbi:MAG TPA: tRNA lysidine(34) synthetase TilS [Amaricoccus sp.]|nr:tRNA lysidine(34) synthetase TilS [Amaricoccus sp.]